MKVMVPKKVADAFDSQKRECKNLKEETYHYLLMAIPFKGVHGSAKVLKDFARDNPTTYLQAIANGYEPIKRVQDELTDMLIEWLERPYVESERKDVEMFADRVTKYFQQQYLRTD